jgi:sulfur carrier protein
MGQSRDRSEVHVEPRDDTPRTAIVLNGEPLVTEARTLDELLAGQGFAPMAVATAVNGEFVPRGARAATLLAAGDKVEVVAPRQGG